MQDRGNPGPESRFLSGLFVKGAGGTESFCLRQRGAFGLAGRFSAGEVALSVVVFRLPLRFLSFGCFSWPGRCQYVRRLALMSLAVTLPPVYISARADFGAGGNHEKQCRWIRSFANEK